MERATRVRGGTQPSVSSLARNWRRSSRTGFRSYQSRSRLRWTPTMQRVISRSTRNACKALWRRCPCSAESRTSRTLTCKHRRAGGWLSYTGCTVNMPTYWRLLVSWQWQNPISICFRASTRVLRPPKAVSNRPLERLLRQRLSQNRYLVHRGQVDELSQPCHLPYQRNSPSSTRQETQRPVPTLHRMQTLSLLDRHPTTRLRRKTHQDLTHHHQICTLLQGISPPRPQIHTHRQVGCILDVRRRNKRHCRRHHEEARRLLLWGHLQLRRT